MSNNKLPKLKVGDLIQQSILGGDILTYEITKVVGEHKYEVKLLHIELT